jgi:hypothetical protein
MTIGAEKLTLQPFADSAFVITRRDVVLCYLKNFGLWIDMVKVQSIKTTGIATGAAGATGQHYKQTLDCFDLGDAPKISELTGFTVAFSASPIAPGL